MVPGVKICHVVGDSAFGGGSRVIIALVKASLEAGAVVTVIATDPAFCRHLRKTGADVTELPCIWRSVRPVRDLRGLLRLKSHFDSAGYDVVHTHTSKAGFVGRVAARLAHVPAVLHTVHGFSFHESTPALVRSAHVALEKIAAACCDRIVTVSTFHRDWAIRLGIAAADKIVAIPNGIDGFEAVSEATRERLRSRLEVNDDDTLVLSASRLAPGKGLEHLVEVGDRLQRKGRGDVRILIAGSGDQADGLQRMIERKHCSDVVRLIGFRDDVAELLYAADVVALPSEREGLSIALLESMATGRAIVASEIATNLEAADGVAVFVAYGDVDGLEAALVDLADHPGQREELGRRARARYRDRYTQQRMLVAYAELYETLIVQCPR